MNKPGFYFWPVGTGDSTTVVIDELTVLQIDIRQMDQSEDDNNEYVAVVDVLLDRLPQLKNKPYLSAFALTHPDKDHVQGFEKLLDEALIGELWFTPRVFREYGEELCRDAEVFQEEAYRRVKKMIEMSGAADPGDRVRIVGYDDLLSEQEFNGFPQEFLTVPGNPVTLIDGDDRAGDFRAFIHAPFKDDSEGDRNDTSLAMQIILGDDPVKGGALLFGDLKYPTIKKIYDVSEQAGNLENLSWRILLAPHHCSKSVMYHTEGEREVLKKDILQRFEDSQVGDGYIVASSDKIPASNSKGDNPPHAKAKARYEELAADDFLCTMEDCKSEEPLFFGCEQGAILLDESSLLGAAKADAVQSAIDEARGGDEPPGEKVGFGK